VFSTSWILDWPGSAAVRRAAAAARALSRWLDPGDGGGGPFSREPSPFLTFVSKRLPVGRPAHPAEATWPRIGMVLGSKAPVVLTGGASHFRLRT
jgi:hypothetical protein